jgi:hypothetical protein
MALRNGIRVNRYLYSDVDASAQIVAKHRVALLAGRFPLLLSAHQPDMFALPQDVTSVRTGDLLAAGTLNNEQWLVVAGWECQDLSSAGNCKGLFGPRSRTFFDALRIVGTLQQLQTRKPPAYILENSLVQFNFNSAEIREEVYPYLVNALGQPVCYDAVQFGAYAHRIRNYWTNLLYPRQFDAILEVVVPPEQYVQEILDDGADPQTVQRLDRPPFYPVNYPKHKLRAFPTLVAYP